MESSRPVVTALIANVAITIIKLVVGLLSRSTAVMAETVHSLSDSVNQLFLLAGLGLSSKPPTSKHPFGRGKEQFFWSFVAAISVFTVSAVFSVYQGAVKLLEPAPPKNIYSTLLVLVSVGLIEGYALSVTYRNISHRASKLQVRGILRFFDVAKDPIILAAFLEDIVAIAGVAVAVISLYLSETFRTGFYDAFGSITIGLLLIGYGVVLALESRDLLLGEGLSRADISRIKALIESMPQVIRVLDIRGVYFGPKRVVLGVDVYFRPELRTSEIESAIDRVEKVVKAEFPMIQFIYVEAENPPGLASTLEGRKASSP
jgi:cation diffusion facilitator family transporter